MEFVGKPGNFYGISGIAFTQSKFQSFILELNIEQIFKKYGIKNVNCTYGMDCYIVSDTSLKATQYYKSVICFDLKYGKVEIIIKDFGIAISKPCITIENLICYDANLYDEVYKFANIVRDWLPFYKNYLA